MLTFLRSAAAVHLVPALAAVLVAGVALRELAARADHGLQRFGPALESLNLPEATRGVVLQRRIFERPRCLPVYGSSELSIAQPTRADRFFRRQRQGFDVCLVGQGGDRCLTMLQELAALGEKVRGKTVAVFLSPVWFLPRPEAEQHEHAAHAQFAATFSPLQTGRLVVDSPLKPALKRQIAARLLDYEPLIRARSPLLAIVLTGLRETDWSRRGLSAAITPFLGLQNQILILQERCHWLALIQHRADMHLARSYYMPRRKRLDWAQLEHDVDRMESKRLQTTFYSRGPALEDSPELRRARRLSDYPDRDEDFIRRMKTAPEWNDLELFLKTARELGVHLLLIGQPINGLYSDYQGVTPAARQEYYQRVDRVAAAYRVPLRDFSAYEEDRSFFMDLVHPSAEAWIHYDQALADFFRRQQN